jgi:hypothetical protein
MHTVNLVAFIDHVQHAINPNEEPAQLLTIAVDKSSDSFPQLQ